MPLHKVTTTMRPDDTIEVDDAELLDLQRLGLIVPTKALDKAAAEIAAAQATGGTITVPAATAPGKKT